MNGALSAQTSAQPTSARTLPFQNSCESPAALVQQANELRSQWNRISLEKAVGLYVTASRCWQTLGDRTREADALKAIGDIYVVLSEYAKAEQSYDKALTLRRSVGDKAAESEALADVAFNLVFQSQKDKARDAATAAVKLSEETSDRARRGRALSVLATALYFAGDSRGALDRGNQALLLISNTQEHETLGQTLLVLGYVHNDLADLDAALGFYKRALTEWRAGRNVWGESKTLASIGLVQTLLGDRDAALAALQATLPILERIGDRMSQGVALNNIAYVYQTVGELDAALIYFLKALRTYQKIQFKLGEAITLQYCADIYTLMGNLKMALDYYDRALPLSQAIQNTLLEAEALNSLGSIHFVLGNRPKALEFFQRSLAEFKKVDHWRGQSSSLNNMGYYQEVTGNQAEAREHYSKALAFARSAQDHEGAASILYNLARSEAALGLHDQARTHIEESLKLNEASRAKVANQELRVSYFASVHQHYEFYIDLLMQLHEKQPNDGFDVKALQASEKARARSLLELLSQTGVDFKKAAQPDLLRKEQTLRTKLNEEYLRTDDDRAKQRSAELLKLETEYEDVKNQIRTTNAHYASIALPASLELEEVKSELIDSETAILEFTLGEKSSFLWVVASDGLKSYRLPARSILETEVQAFLDGLQAFAGNDRVQTRQLETEYWQRAFKLGKLIFQDALKHTTATRLLIVREGVLQSVPFAALTKPSETQDPAQPRALAEDYELVDLPSISVLSALKRQQIKRAPATHAAAVFADPVFEPNDPRIQKAGAGRSGLTQNARTESKVRSALRSTSFARGIRRLFFSRDEAQAILSIAPDSFLALDFRANRATVLGSELSKYRIIHFATHGVLNSKHPELSGILLSMVDEKGRSQDGFLQLADIYRLNLPVELVVLSACETGLGKTVRGEGLIGLTRGFMYAGAARVLASLWKVEDAATAALMEQFYKEMFKNGKRPAAALRDAQMHVSRTKRWRSPYYWAGFVLQGDWR